MFEQAAMLNWSAIQTRAHISLGLVCIYEHSGGREGLCVDRVECPNYSAYRYNRRHLYWRPWQHRHGLSISKMHDKRKGASGGPGGHMK